MLVNIAFGVVTLLLGAGTVVFLEWWHHDEWHIPVVFWLGDGILLSVFNTITVTDVLSYPYPPIAFLVAGAASLLSCLIYQFCERRFHTGSVVSPTELYHVFFIVLESFYGVLALFTVTSLISLPVLLVLAYSVTLAVSVIR